MRPDRGGDLRPDARVARRFPENVLTLVLDEAHSYTGTQGTEVAYLIRRLFERLGVGPEQVRCVATSATFGGGDEAAERVRGFAADLFGQPAERFSVVRDETVGVSQDLPDPTPEELTAFADFQKKISTRDTTDESDLQDVCSAFVASLGITPAGKPAAQELFGALDDHPRIMDVRGRTARQAKRLRRALGRGVGRVRRRRRRGIGRRRGSSLPGLSPARRPTRPPRRSFRAACTSCSAASAACGPASTRGVPRRRRRRRERPCGKLYAEPRVWCECSARVLEVFHCRVCGLVFLGGIPDSEGRLWPYEPDLEGGFQDYDSYKVLAAEDPNLPAARAKNWAEERRSVATTGPTTLSDKGARPFWASSEPGKYGELPFTCPRCDARGSANSNVIQPMRSTGPQALRVLMEQPFRDQPPRTVAESSGNGQRQSPQKKPRWAFKSTNVAAPTRSALENPNRGRKALIFSDGRQEAATLAVNLTQLHMRDLFRQLLLIILEKDVRGAGLREMPVPRLREKILELALSRGIDPTLGEDETFWGTMATSPYEASRKAAPLLEAYLRREVADRQVGVESLGLARWVLDFEGDNAEDIVPPLEPFDARETVSLVHAVIRILAGYDVLLPGTGDPRDWPAELVAERSRRLIVRDKVSDDRTFTWGPGSRNRLTRYLERVCDLSGLGATEVAPFDGEAVGRVPPRHGCRADRERREVGLGRAPQPPRDGPDVGAGRPVRLLRVPELGHRSGRLRAVRRHLPGGRNGLRRGEELLPEGREPGPRRRRESGSLPPQGAGTHGADLGDESRHPRATLPGQVHL